MLIFFEIQSTEDWNELLFRAIDASNEVDHGPIYNNRPWLFYIFLIFISTTTFFLLNFLITILITSYQYQSTKKYRLDDMKPHEKNWIKMQSYMIEAKLTP